MSGCACWSSRTSRGWRTCCARGAHAGRHGGGRHRRAAPTRCGWRARRPTTRSCSTSCCPDVDGFEVCRRLRADGVWAPILMLTARDAVADRVDGPRHGRRRLPAQAVRLRRADRAAARAGPPRRPRAPGRARGRRPAAGPRGAARLARRRRARACRAKEFALLEALMRRPGEVLTRDDLLEAAGTWPTRTARTSSTPTCGCCARRSTGRSARDARDRARRTATGCRRREAPAPSAHHGRASCSRRRVALLAVGSSIHAGAARPARRTRSTRRSRPRATAVARLLVERGRVGPGLTTGLDDPGETFTQVIGPDGTAACSSTPGLPLRPVLGRGGGRRGRRRGRRRPAARRRASTRTTRRARRSTSTRSRRPARAVRDRPRAGAARRRRRVGGDALRDHHRRDLRGPRRGAGRAAARRCGWARRSALVLVGAGGLHRPSGARLRPLDATLARLKRALASERQLVADVSHELRTPLAIISGELELARADGAPARRLDASVAVAARRGAPARRASATTCCCWRAADAGRLELRPRAARRARAARATTRGASRRAPGAVASRRRRASCVDGDRLRLEQALGNLVDNALAHGARPSCCRAARERRPRGARRARPRRPASRPTCSRTPSSASPAAAPGGRAPAPASGSRSCRWWPRRTGAGRRWPRRAQAAAPRSGSGFHRSFTRLSPWWRA